MNSAQKLTINAADPVITDLSNIQQPANFNSIHLYQYIESNINKLDSVSSFNNLQQPANSGNLTESTINSVQPTNSNNLTQVTLNNSASVNNPFEAKNGKILSPFPPTPKADLEYYGGYTIPNLQYFNFYLGPKNSWSTSDISNIDQSLSQAMSDARLNSVVSQYFSGELVTSKFLGSDQVEAPIPRTITQRALENLLSSVGEQGGFDGIDLSSTVLNFLLPQGTILTQDTASSLHGLAGYHGSVDFYGTDYQAHSVYYSIGVYSEGYNYLLGSQNGIPVFNTPWKNVVATSYHELNEVRTDPDVEKSNQTGDNSYLGWYSQIGGEIGDYPIQEVTIKGLPLVVKDTPLLNGQTSPVQILYSNAVHGPEDPTTITLDINFDPARYGASYSDLIVNIGYNLPALTAHYYNIGITEGRNPNLFDPYEYEASNPDLITAFGTNISAIEQHYISHGYYEHRPTNSFNAKRYIASYGDLIQAFGENLAAATKQYITSGYFEHRNPNLFDPVAYLNKNPDLKAVFGNNLDAATDHYIQHGYYEHRTWM